MADNFSEKLYWVWLTTVMGYAPIGIQNILCKFSPEEAFKADSDTLISAGIGTKTAEKLTDKSLDRAKLILSDCESLGVNIIPLTSPDYPYALHRLRNKPCLLYVRGDIGVLRGHRIAGFVGSREISEQGREYSEKKAAELISEGNILVSGLAEGVDTVAAEMSVKAGVPTVAVIGVGIDKYFPASNRALTKQIIQNGAVISEYPPRSNSRYFVQRNRIIAGLSDSLYVMQASNKSGAITTAEIALRHRIPTYALLLDGPNFDGCRRIIEMGGTPIDGNVERSVKNKKSSSAPKKSVMHRKRETPEELDGIKKYIWERLAVSPETDAALAEGGYEIADLLCVLTEMEIEGYIKSLPGGKFTLK